MAIHFALSEVNRHSSHQKLPKAAGPGATLAVIADDEERSDLADLDTRLAEFDRKLREIQSELAPDRAVPPTRPAALAEVLAAHSQAPPPAYEPPPAHEPPPA